MKKRVLLLTILFFLALSNQHYIDSSDKDGNANIVDAFMASNASMTDHTINIIFNNPIGLNRAREVFKLTGAPVKIQGLLLYQRKDLDITFRMNSKNLVESVCIVSPRILESYYWEEINSKLMKKNIQSKQFLTITGFYDGKMDDVDMEKTIQKLFICLKAECVEGGFIGDSFISASGYTPSIKEYILTAGNKININIALKYRPKENKTTLILSTPIIYGDY